MRFPIYSKSSNPAIDPPILRKKLPYIESQVADLLADWVDPLDKTKGVICRSVRAFKQEDSLQRIAGSGFDSAWSIIPSGYAGPGVWQLKTDKGTL